MLGFIFCVIAGAAMSLQGVMNTRLGEGMGTMEANAFVQVTAAALSLAALLFYRTGSFSGLTQVHWLYWLGGALGLVITVTVMLGMIYDDLNYENEAFVFANQMKFVKPLKPYEVFMANIEAGSDKQLIIRDLVESYSLSIGQVKGYGVICAVSALEGIYDKFGYHILDRTLRLCAGTWEGDMNSLCANFLNGVARLVNTYGDKLKDELFKERVGATSVKQLTRNAKERRPGSLGFAEAMLVAYNRKCKYPLVWNKLYEKNLGTSDALDVDVDLPDDEVDEAETVEE